tara:strand:+ start:7245 stop:7673 length:429 start_codon:yes stop_codon:yes gene_type:complete
MEEKRKIEILKSQLGLDITTDISKFDKVDCTIYTESTADGYDVYVLTNNPSNVSICEDVYYYDHDIADSFAEQVRYGDTSFYIDDYIYEDCYMEDKLLEMFDEYIEDIVEGDSTTEEEKKFLVEEYGLEEKLDVKQDLTIKK